MTVTAWIATSFRPAMSETALALLVRGTGVLLLLTLALLARHAGRLLMSERWGGYVDPSTWHDWLLRPRVIWPIYGLWTAAALALALGHALLLAASINLILSWFFFVRLRWQSASRGFGAPGFMTCWLAAAVWVLLVTRAAAPAWEWLAILTLQADLAFIMLSAGLYKARSGYRHGRGMQFGLANPQWGYWTSVFRTWPVDHWLFRALNQMAWSTEVVAAVLMLMPPTRQIGGWLIILSFLLIAGLIRLGTLCWMVMLACTVFFHPGSLGDRLSSALVAPLDPTTAWPFGAIVIPACLAVYLVLLMPSHLGLWYNAYRRKRLPELAQCWLDRWTNAFGIIIWRVFSADHTEFFVRVFHVDGGRPIELTRWGWPPWGRFNHVGESITLTSLVTWQRYFHSDALVHRRLLRVARTFGVPGPVIFRIVRLDAAAGGFHERDVSEWTVDLESRRVDERRLDAQDASREAVRRSAIYQADRPGTYAPEPR